MYFPLFAYFFNSDATGSFPDYPDEEEGGSALIFSEKDPQQVNYTLRQKYWFVAYFCSSLQKENDDLCTHFFQLMEEIAAKEEEDSNNKPKGKEEKKEKGKKDKGKGDEEVRAHHCIKYEYGISWSRI